MHEYTCSVYILHVLEWYPVLRDYCERKTHSLKHRKDVWLTLKTELKQFCPGTSYASGSSY